MNLTPIKANMTEIKIGKLVVLFSYKTPVACVYYTTEHGLEYFQTEKKWSRTTSRHINTWLNGNGAKYKPQEFFDNLLAEVK